MVADLFVAADLLPAFLTFAIHSSAWLALAWLATTCMRGLRARVRESIWKLAIVAAFASPVLQWCLVDRGWFGHIETLPVAQSSSDAIDQDEAVTPPLGLASQGVPAASAIGDGPKPAPSELATTASNVGSLRTPDTSKGEPTATTLSAADATVVAASDSRPFWLITIVLLASLLGFGLWSIERIRLALWMRSRRPHPDGRLQQRFAAMQAQLGLKGVELSVHRDLLSPVAFGVFRREVCVPARGPERLDAGELDAMFAHELAHHCRRDPLWLGVFALCARALPWQPLLGIARRRWETLAEFSCDAIAAERAGPHPVASCLLEVATWVAGPRRRLALSGMAVHRTGLRCRVERLLSPKEAPRLGWHSGWLAPLFVGSLAGTVFALPSVGGQDPTQDRPVFERSADDPSSSTTGTADTRGREDPPAETSTGVPAEKPSRTPDETPSRASADKPSREAWPSEGPTADRPRPELPLDRRGPRSSRSTPRSNTTGTSDISRGGLGATGRTPMDNRSSEVIRTRMARVAAAIALVDQLAELDEICLALSQDFTALQRDLVARDMNRQALSELRELGERLNRLDARRVQLRQKIFNAILASKKESR